MSEWLLRGALLTAGWAQTSTGSYRAGFTFYLSINILMKEQIVFGSDEKM